jgi:Family of unknown function (DUF5317)
MYALIAAPLLAGVLAGYALGGRLSWLARNRIRAVWLPWLAGGLQFVQFEWESARSAVESRVHVSLLVPIFGLVGAWVLVNLPRRALALRIAGAVILLGGAMNAAAILANGRMPYAESAVRAAQLSTDQRERAMRSPKHVAADEHARLRWLGDVIPVAPIGNVVSAGDIVLLAGATALIAAGMRRSASRRPDRAPIAKLLVRSWAGVEQRPR